MQERDSFGFLTIRGTDDVSAARPARREYPLELDARDNVREGLVAVLILLDRVELRSASRKYNASHLNVQLFRFLVVVDRIGLADL